MTENCKSAPRLNIIPTRVACAVHLEPYRPKWPFGYPTFSMRLIDATLSDESFLKEVENIEAALDARPACERVYPATLLAAYEQSQIGVVRRCEVCRRLAMGTPYRHLGGGYGHLCFACLVYRMENARA